MVKATAIAHPIQGLIKYHGLRNYELRIPLHDSISVCVAPYESRTTIELREDLDTDVFEIDGQPAMGRAHERALIVVDFLRRLAKRTEKVSMRSVNNFQSNIGLGASSSGFAALTLAAHEAFGLSLTRRELTTVARIGAGSASRALAGGYAHWYAGETHEASYAEQIGNANNLPLGIVMAIIPAFKSTDDSHTEVLTSPFLPCRVAYAKAALDDLRMGVIDGDFSKVGLLAEKDSLSLHATTMTGENGILHWQPETIMVFHLVRKMRNEGLECYFSVDTGATVYINCRPADTEAVRARIAALGIETALGEVGGAARLVDEHLL